MADFRMSVDDLLVVPVSLEIVSLHIEPVMNWQKTGLTAVAPKVVNKLLVPLH